MSQNGCHELESPHNSLNVRLGSFALIVGVDMLLRLLLTTDSELCEDGLDDTLFKDHKNNEFLKK